MDSVDTNEINSLPNSETTTARENNFETGNVIDQTIIVPRRKDYVEINWGGGFESWLLCRFFTPMDGNCLFHAISSSFFDPYRKETINNKHMSRTKMVSILRHELAEKLGSKISDNSDSLTHYEILNGGNMKLFSEEVPEFKLNYMKSQLDSTNPIGYGYMEFIGNSLNKDIYILSASNRGIYVTDELKYSIKGNRNSIVLYYINGHYELVGINNTDGTFDTHFSPNHSFIRFLYGNVKECINYSTRIQ